MKDELTIKPIPKAGDFYYNEGGSLIFIYQQHFDVYYGYNFSSKKNEVYQFLKNFELLDGDAACNSIDIKFKIVINVQSLIRAATRKDE